MHRSSLSVVLLTIATVIFAATASAQVTTATYYGVVQDPSGAVIAGASVTLTQEETAAARTQETSATGEFGFDFLPVGPYTLRIEVEGFKAHAETGILLGAAQRLRRIFQLEIGSTTETVEVVGTAPLVNSVSAEQHESISRLEVTELPLQRRDISDVISLGTGILFGERKESRGKMFNMNGLGRAGANITMDGIDASASPELPQTNQDGGFNYIGVVSMEAVQEIEVTKGSFQAEYGRTLSGNINVITKSGTNTWHGSGFGLFSSEELNARNQLLQTKPGYTYNQFGGSLGGPIVRDKVFIFGAYESYRERAFRPVQGDTPTQLLRDMMLAAVPEYKMVLDLFPLPTEAHGPDALAARFLGASSLQANTDHFVLRPDVWLKDNMRISGTYVADNPDRSIPRFPLSRSFVGNLDRYAITFTTFGPSWSSESRFGWNRADRDRIDEFWFQRDPNQEESMLGGRRVPGISIQSLGIGIQGELNTKGEAPNWSLDQKVSYTLGRHTLKFGGQFFRMHSGRGGIENPVIQYGTLGQVLANTPTRTTYLFGIPPWQSTSLSLGFFFQDDWRVNNKLVLNFGLRYDYYDNWAVKNAFDDGPPHIFNAQLNFADFTFGPRQPIGEGFAPDKMNLGPRFGFAYDMDGQGKTIIRGGFGISFTPVNSSIFSGTPIMSENIPRTSRFTEKESARLGLAFPSWNEEVLDLIAGEGGASFSSFRLMDTKLKPSYAINYTLGIQRALTDTLVLESAFVANRGVKFVYDRNYNEPDRLTGIRPNPNLGGALYFDNSESTHYVSWQSSLRKRYSRGLVTNVHYTWGKIINYGTGDLGPLADRAFLQEFFDIQANKGPSNDNITHNFIADLVYELPDFNSLGSAARHVIGGWQVSSIVRAATGLPITLSQPSARARSRPDLIDPDNAVLDQGQQFLNKAAFAKVPIVKASSQPIRSGNVGRGFLDAPGSFLLDFSFGKNISVGEKVTVALRADLLNALNHTNPSGLVTNINSGQFGRLRSTLGPREIQLHLRISF